MRPRSAWHLLGAVKVWPANADICGAEQVRRPALTALRAIAADGGSMSCGREPDDCRFQFLTKFERVIDLKTSRVRGLTISEPFLRSSDKTYLLCSTRGRYQGSSWWTRGLSGLLRLSNQSRLH
jgi:hypothetical protein